MIMNMILDSGTFEFTLFTIITVESDNLHIKCFTDYSTESYDGKYTHFPGLNNSLDITQIRIGKRRLITTLYTETL